MSGDVPVVRVDGIAVLRLRGELDHLSVRAIEDDVLTVTANDPWVVVDLEQVGFLDSCALRLLDVLARGCGKRGGRLVVVAPEGGAARFTLRVAGFPEDRVAGSAADARQRLTALR